MNVNITIVGYINESQALCYQCVLPEEAKDPEVDRLYSHHESDFEDGGLYCDRCGDVIFADQSCPEGCGVLLDDHDDLVGDKYYCPSKPRATARIVESIDGTPFNVAVYHEVVAGTGEDALRSLVAYLGGKVATIELEDPS